MALRQISKRIVLLGLALMIAACAPIDAPNNNDIPFPDIEVFVDEYDPSETLIVPMGMNFTYTAPNPNRRWQASGQQVSLIGRYFTQIRINVTEKNPQQSLADVLPLVTAETYEIQEADGVQYVEGFDAIDTRVMFVDKGDFVVRFQLIDAITDDIPDEYIDDFREIALTGAVYTFD